MVDMSENRTTRGTTKITKSKDAMTGKLTAQKKMRFVLPARETIRGFPGGEIAGVAELRRSIP